MSDVDSLIQGCRKRGGYIPPIFEIFADFRFFKSTEIPKQKQKSRIIPPMLNTDRHRWSNETHFIGVRMKS